MRGTLLLICTLVTASLATSSLAREPAGHAAAAQEEMKRLEGTWVPMSVEADGETHPSQAPKVTIRGGQWIQHALPGELASLPPIAIVVNPAVTPKQLDLLDEAETIPGIYELSVNQLTLAQPYPLRDEKAASIGPRPTRFVTRRGDNFVITRYRRDQPR